MQTTAARSTARANKATYISAQDRGCAPIREHARARHAMAKLRPTYAFVKRLEVLSSGRLHLKDSIKTVTLTYNVHGSDSSGIRLVLMK